jgi:large subunit ribosomal protein L7Ae
MVSAYDVIEKARKTGKIEKGTNEVTKAIERATAKFVVYASDVSPKEIVQHIPILCNEKNIPCTEVDKKEKLGIAAGLSVPCASVCITSLGTAEKDLESFLKSKKIN